MIYAYDYDDRMDILERFAPLHGITEIQELRVLTQRIMDLPEPEQGPRGLVMWACCIRQNDPGEKMLRNIPPIEVYVTAEEKPSHYSGWGPTIQTTAYQNNKRSKEIKIFTNNHGNLVLCDTYDEACRHYNAKVDSYLHWTQITLEHRTQFLQNRLRELREAHIGGHIAETVVTPDA